MRRKTFLIAVCLAALAAAPAAAGIKVVASIKPVHSLVSAIMQGAGAPELMVDGAASPHSYALKPSQAAALQEADVVFWVGPGLESFLEKSIGTIGSAAASVELAQAPGIELLDIRQGAMFEAEHDDGDADGRDHGAHDMHVWLDPVNAKAMAAAIAGRLADADPENAALYRENAATLRAALDALQAETAASLAPVREHRFLVFHDAFHYFENRFGLEAAGSITLSPEATPGAERIADIRALLAEHGADCVFSEPQFDPKLVGVVTEGTDIRTASLDPLGAALEPGPGLYPALIETMANSIKACLAGES